MRKRLRTTFLWLCLLTALLCPWLWYRSYQIPTEARVGIFGHWLGIAAVNGHFHIANFSWLWECRLDPTGNITGGTNEDQDDPLQLNFGRADEFASDSDRGRGWLVFSHTPNTMHALFYSLMLIEQYRDIYFSIAVPLTLSLIYLAIRIIKWHFNGRDAGTVPCTHCGYDLRAHIQIQAARRCPECGLLFKLDDNPPDSLNILRRSAQWLKRKTLPTACALAALLLCATLCSRYYSTTIYFGWQNIYSLVISHGAFTIYPDWNAGDRTPNRIDHGRFFIDEDAPVRKHYWSSSGLNIIKNSESNPPDRVVGAAPRYFQYYIDLWGDDLDHPYRSPNCYGIHGPAWLLITLLAIIPAYTLAEKIAPRLKKRASPP